MYDMEGAKTFWVGADAKPRDLLEQFALHTLWSHMEYAGYSRSWSGRRAANGRPLLGAEWWIQHREAEDPRGLEWHFDEDIALYEDEGLTLSPALATVTYLTSSGAPLLILSPLRLRQLSDGSESMLVGLDAESSAEVYMSHPTAGKHLAFDGRLLHGIPAGDERVQRAAGERLSLMVNLWAGRQPTGWRDGRMSYGAATSDEVRRALPTEPESELQPEPESVLLRLQDAAEVDVVLARGPGSHGGDRTGAQTFELDVDCGPWKFDGVRLPVHMHPARGLSCVRLGKGSVRSRYCESGWG